MSKVRSNFFQIFCHGKHPLSPTPCTPSLQGVLQGTQPNQSIASQFLRGQIKSYRLLEIGTAPELTINWVSSFNLSSFLYSFPENLTLDSIQKKNLGVFYLLFKKAVEIMERAVWMSCLKNKWTWNAITIFNCIIS